MKFLRNVLHLFGIVYLRFRALPRVWCVWLVGVNAACLLYMQHVEAQAVLAVTAISVVIQAVIYGRIGFTRVLGVVHLMWIPMFAWMATRLDVIGSDPGLTAWLTVLFATNLVSLIVDLAEGARYLRGDRASHYHWDRSALA